MTNIIGIIGDRGTGKSLLATKLALKAKKNGFKIFSNMKFTFEHEYINPENVEKILDVEEELQNSIVIIDEMPTFLDSRESMSKKNKLITTFLRHTRKLSVTLVYITQFLHMIDKRLRDFTNIFYFTKSLGDDWFMFIRSNRNIFGELEFQQPTMYYGKKYYDYYDTNEIIKIK